MPPVTNPQPALRIGFLLLPQFGLLSLSGALDVLAAANRILDEPVYASVILATGTESAVNAGALRIPVDFALENAPALDSVFVVSETPVPQRGFKMLLHGCRVFRHPVLSRIRL